MMRKKVLLARLSQVENALVDKAGTIALLEMKNKLLTKELDDKNEYIAKLLDKNGDLTDTTIKLHGEKAGLIKYVKKQRNVLRFRDEEIARLNNNLNAMMVTYQQNDEAFQKALEANALLAGKVEAFEKCLEKTEA